MVKKMAGECILCRVADKRDLASTVFEDHLIMACLHINPAAKGHTVIFPKKHTKAVEDLSVYLAGYLFSLVPSLARAIGLATSCTAVNLRIDQYASGGQDLSHVHIHLVPRYTGDGLGLELGNEPSLAVARAPDAAQKELEEVARDIRAKLGIPMREQ